MDKNIEEEQSLINNQDEETRDEVDTMVQTVNATVAHSRLEERKSSESSASSVSSSKSNLSSTLLA